jgi:hypothetical protein
MLGEQYISTIQSGFPVVFSMNDDDDDDDNDNDDHRNAHIVCAWWSGRLNLYGGA